MATFTMGIVFPFANQKGVISGAVTGCLFGWMIFFGSKTDPNSPYLKSLVPSTINTTECQHQEWLGDIQNYTQQFNLERPYVTDGIGNCEQSASQFCSDKLSTRPLMGISVAQDDELNNGSNFQVIIVNDTMDNINNIVNDGQAYFQDATKTEWYV